MFVKINRTKGGVRRANRSSTTQFRHRYFFCAKISGGAYFGLEAGKDGSFPADEAVGVLAMNCMVRGLSPRDYAVFVPLEEHELKGLYEKTAKLLQAGKSLYSEIRLTPREEEVLNGLTCNLTNKEIAVALKLTERTVKFHVSSLLTKFSVRNRVDLAFEAWRYMPTSSALPTPGASQKAPPRGKTRAPHGKRSHADGSSQSANGGILA
jgi:DNA-binding CsgD family transcriptional regulator